MALTEAGLTVSRRSRWYETAPVPASDQPWYVNGVAEMTTSLEADVLLARLHQIEGAFGRVRRIRNEARVLDLDLLAYHDLVVTSAGLTLPHPRLRDRAFVLLPLAELAPQWRHPIGGEPIARMIKRLDPGQQSRILDEPAA